VGSFDENELYVIPEVGKSCKHSFGQLVRLWGKHLRVEIVVCRRCGAENIIKVVRELASELAFATPRLQVTRDRQVEFLIGFHGRIERALDYLLAELAREVLESRHLL